MSNKIKRNDICPCGSGKKYKKCCERNVEKTNTKPEIEETMSPEEKQEQMRKIAQFLTIASAWSNT